MTQKEDIERNLDELFAAEPSSFVAARDALAKRLRNEGQAEAAAEVAKLRKPTAVAWALNQLSRREGGQVEALLRQDERLRELMHSGGRGADLRKVSEERKAVVRDLARLASAVLAGAGHKPTATAADRIFETLQAVATDPEAREAFRAGRLAGDVRPSGFGEALVVAPAAGADGDAAATEARERLAAARQTARERADRVDELRRSTERLEREASEAERRAARARRDADRAASELEKAEAAAAEAAGAVAELERGPG